MHVPVFTHEDPEILARALEFVKGHHDLTEQQLREEVPVGPPAHVRQVVTRYAELGVSAILLPARGTERPSRTWTAR